jgi:hypothetical protein
VGQQPLVDPIEVSRRPVAREDHLQAASLRPVDETQQLGLRLRLPVQVLNVVEQQQPDPFPLPPPRLEIAALGRVAQLLHVVLGRAVFRCKRGVDLHGMEAEGRQQVRLAQARCGIEEQRVVDLSRGLRHGARRGHGQSVRRADHEVLEAEVAVEHA